LLALPGPRAGIEQSGRLGCFLAGVSLIKAEAFIKPAKRGMHGKAGPDEGIMAWRRTRFPHIPNSSLTNYKNFALSVQNSTVGNLDLASFQLPENPDELRALLEMINKVLDGKNLRAAYAANGKAIEAQQKGGDRAPRDPETGKRLSAPRRTHQQIEAEKAEDYATNNIKLFLETLKKWEAHAYYHHLDDKRLLVLPPILSWRMGSAMGLRRCGRWRRASAPLGRGVL